MQNGDFQISDAVRDKDIQSLKEFARSVIKQYCWSLFIYEPDGGSIQDLAEKLGLIEPCIATAEDVNEFTDFEVGDTIFRFTDVLKGVEQ